MVFRVRRNGEGQEWPGYFTMIIKNKKSPFYALGIIQSRWRGKKGGTTDDIGNDQGGPMRGAKKFRVQQEGDSKNKP